MTTCCETCACKSDKFCSPLNKAEVNCGMHIQGLQSSMADGGNALGSMQRLVEERTQQATTAQQALLHLQQDHARLTANLHIAQEQAAMRLASICIHCRPCMHK